MKAKQFVIRLCLGLTLLFCAYCINLLWHQPAFGTIQNGQPQFGNTELVLTATSTAGLTGSALNLASSGSTVGTSSTVCYNMTLYPSITYTGSGTASLYMGGSSAGCTCLLATGGSAQFSGASGTVTSGTATVTSYVSPVVTPISVPQALNTNQLWFKLTNSDSTSTATARVESVYVQ